LAAAIAANAIATNWLAATRLSGSVEWFGQPPFRMSRSGWMLWTVRRAIAMASPRPSSGVS
jgi:hypothetical protein